MEILFGDGELLRATENHPVLTRRGWVRARDLNVGDDLVHVSNEHVYGLSFDENHKVTEIGDLFDSAHLICGSTLELNRSNTEFDADVSNGEVEVVDVYRFLSDGFEPSKAKGFVEFILSETEKTGFRFFVDGLFDKNLLSFLQTSTSVLSGYNNRFSLLFREFGHTNVICLGFIAALNVMCREESGDDVSCNAIFLAKKKLGRSVEVLLNNINGQFFTPVVFDGEIVRLQPPSESGDFDSVLLNRGIRRGASVDFIKGVKEIRVIGDFAGHVYNLSTLTGWYNCNYTTVHNCRCIYRPVLPKELLNG